jgi:cytoplasmic iron level regulating protein YaaA (DUF328/UPF0246 family)
MKILFSPSETKIQGGDDISVNKNDYIFPSLLDKHKEVLNNYHGYIKNQSDEKLSKLFGLKKQADIDIFKSVNIFKDPTMKAIQRYTGVAYDYLKYNDLETKQQTFIDENMIIFSNLYGSIFAKYQIPNYKLKQGEKLDDFAIEKFYKEYFSDALDALLEDEFTIDLRAGFYLKFYTPKVSHVTMKFLKGGKVVSHWAKAYRGNIARELAHYQPQNEQEFQKIAFENLKIEEIIKRKNKTEYIFSISS